MKSLNPAEPLIDFVKQINVPINCTCQLLLVSASASQVQYANRQIYYGVKLVGVRGFYSGVNLAYAIFTPQVTAIATPELLLSRKINPVEFYEE